METQTDPPEMVEKWTQHPQDGAFVCGGITVLINICGAYIDNIHLIALLNEGFQQKITKLIKFFLGGREQGVSLRKLHIVRP